MRQKAKKNNLINFPENTKSSIQENSLLSMIKRIEQMKDENQRLSEMAAKAILKALGAKDHYTYDHSLRVCHYSLILGKELGMTDEEIFELQLSALFHDIGKIGTPDSVLNKPTRLTEEEFNIMKKHPEQSYEILKEFDKFSQIAINARHHHERYDGRGYPDKLKGEEIPLCSRIILIADTFDAMTSTRVYRKGLESEIAYSELLEFSGSQFDPKLVVIFIEAMKKEKLNKNDEFYVPLLKQSFPKKAA
jgi:putative nucleotidyltransferase with HDIG domain